MGPDRFENLSLRLVKKPRQRRRYDLIRVTIFVTEVKNLKLFGRLPAFWRDPHTVEKPSAAPGRDKSKDSYECRQDA
jgi:hypothetical protein